MFYSSVPLTIYIYFLAAILGLVMGSFLNCCAVRLVKGESILRGRSHCGVCGHTLSPAELVPVFSWLFLKGKCRHCGEKISPKYPLSEIASAVVFVTAVYKCGLSVELIEMLLLASVLLCISFADIEDYIIPDRLIITGIAVRIVFILISGDILSESLKSLIGGLSISLLVFIIVILMDKLLGKESMGGGDIKLLFMVGIYFSWKINLLAIILACLIGLMSAIVIKKQSNHEEYLPFGPSIAAGFWLSFIVGNTVIDWYLSLLY